MGETEPVSTFGADAAGASVFDERAGVTRTEDNYDDARSGRAQRASRGSLT